MIEGALEYLDAENITGYIPDNFFEVEQKKKTKWYRKSQFPYNKEKDCYICPAGYELPYSYTQKRKGKPDVRVYKGETCLHCPSRESCTKAQFRTISRDPREHHTEDMRTRLKTEKGIHMKKQRSTTVEPTFGNMKQNKKFTHFLLRGKEKAAAEFILMCIAINIEKIYTYTTVHHTDLNSVLQSVT